MMEGVEIEEPKGELQSGGEEVHDETRAADDPSPTALGVVVLPDGGGVDVATSQGRYVSVKAVEVSLEDGRAAVLVFGLHSLEPRCPERL